MHSLVYEYLITIACGQATTTFREIMPIIGHSPMSTSARIILAGALAEISALENGQGRPLLPAVVLREDDFWPEEGFIDTARKLGRHTGKDDRFFFLNELSAVHDAWNFY